VGNTISAGLQEPADATPSRAMRPEAGDVRALCGGLTPRHEAEWIAKDMLDRIVKEGAAPGDLAMLARTNAGVGLVEMALVLERIPVQVSGRTFFAHPDIEAALCYGLLVEHDAPAALKVVLNKPKRYLSGKLLDGLTRRMEAGEGMLDALQSMAATFRGRSRENIQSLIDALKSVRKAGWPAAIWEINDLLELDQVPLRTEASDPSDDKVARAETFLTVAEDFATATELYQFAQACAAGRGTGVKPAQVSTVHGFKGLEAKHVYVSASSGVFPHKRATSGKRYQEEERLFYVAMTRAQDTLTATWSLEDYSGKKAGASPFLREWVLPLLEKAATPDDLTPEQLEKIQLRLVKVLKVARMSGHPQEQENAWRRVGEQFQLYEGHLRPVDYNLTPAERRRMTRALRR